MTKKLSKKDVKGLDKFQKNAEFILGFFKNFKKIIFITLGITVIGGFSVALFLHLKEKNEIKSQEKYYSIKKEYDQILRKIEDELSKNKKQDNTSSKSKELLKGLNIEDDIEIQFTEELYQEKFKDIAINLNNFIQEHKNTYASYLALLTLSDLYNKFEKYQIGLDLLKKNDKCFNNKSLLCGLVLFQLANFYMQNEKNCEKSLKIWEKITKNENWKTLHPNSYLYSGLCYQETNAFDKARSIYKKIQAKYVDTYSAKLANIYLRYMNYF